MVGISYRNPPGDANEKLLKLCQVLREGEADIESLDDDLDMSAVFNRYTEVDSLDFSMRRSDRGV